MKLNHDCIRKVLLLLEDMCNISMNNDTYCWKSANISDLCDALPDFDRKDIFYSLFNLEQAGFIDVLSQYADGGVYVYSVNYITFTGHEYLANIKNDNNWKKTKEIGSKVGALSLNIISKIAEGVATAYFKKELGLL